MKEAVAGREPRRARADATIAKRRTRSGSMTAYYLCLPSHLRARAPLLVCVHGISRNAAEHMRHFAPLAAERGVTVVAPLFSEPDFPDYQRLGRKGRGRRADLALHEVLAELAECDGVGAEKIHLFGHSGGGQFVHRYVMANPARVARFVVSAAGWYTYPDRERPFPFGIASSPFLPDLAFDPEAFLRVPGTVFIGERDLGRGRSLRTTPLIDRAQGRNRVERAQAWVRAMNDEAARRGLPRPLDLQLLPSARHRFADVAGAGGAPARAFQCLFGAQAA